MPRILMEDLPFQSKKDKENVLRVFGRLQDMKLKRQEWGDTFWDKADDLYASIPSDTPPEDWMANIFVPLVQATELAVLAEITERNTNWVCQPLNRASIKKAEKLQAITEWTQHKGNWRAEQFDFNFEKLHYGTAVWNEYYREDRRTIRKRVIKKVKGKEVEEIETEDIKEFDDVHGRVVHIRDFYLDDRCTDIRNANDCIERSVMNKEKFLQTFGKYKKSDKVKEWGFIKPKSEKKVKEAAKAKSGFVVLPDDLKDDDVELLRYYNKVRDEHILIANGVMIVEEPIPYDHKQLPYAMDVAIPRPRCPYGFGIPYSLEATNEELNALHNMALDEAKIDVHKPTFVGGSSMVDEEEFQLRPRTFIPVDDVDQVREYASSGIQASFFQMMEETKQTGRVASGLDVRFAEATSPSGGTDTATEVQRLAESSLRRIGLYNKMLEIRALPRIGMLRTANIQQFYRDPLRVEAAIGDDGAVKMNEEGEPEYVAEWREIRFQPKGKTNFDFMKVKPSDIRGQFDVYVEPQATRPMSQALLAKRLNTAMQTVLSFPQMIELVDLPELTRHFFKALQLPYALVRDTLKDDDEQDFKLAEYENYGLINGLKVPPTTNPSQEHVAVHAMYIYQTDNAGRLLGENSYTEQFQGLPEDVKKNFLDHYRADMKKLAAKGIVSAEDVARTPGVGGTGTRSSGAGEEIETTGQETTREEV